MHAIAPEWVIISLVAINLACSVGGLALKDLRPYFGTLATGLILLILLFVR